jgi:hypothetical protein
VDPEDVGNALMRSRTIEMRGILTGDTMEMPLTENENMIQAFASYLANEALADRIGLGCLHRGFEHLHLLSSVTRVKHLYRLLIPAVLSQAKTTVADGALWPYRVYGM